MDAIKAKVGIFAAYFIYRWTVGLAYQKGLVVEAAGAAALAAFLTGKVMRLQFFFDSDSIEEFSLQLEAKVGLESLRGKRVVVVVTGSNVSPNELVELTK